MRISKEYCEKSKVLALLGKISKHQTDIPLSEPPDNDSNESTSSVGRRAHQLHPRSLGHFNLQLKRSLDLGELKVDEGRVHVTTSVEVGEHLARLVDMAASHEVAGGLGKEEEAEKLESGDGALEERWDSPGPGVGELEGAESAPRSTEVEISANKEKILGSCRSIHDGTKVEKCVVHGRDLAAVCRIGELSNQDRAGLGDA